MILLRKRRAHKRTFTGCKTCRSRHVRCDEVFGLDGACNNCSRMQLTCEVASHRSEMRLYTPDSYSKSSHQRRWIKATLEVDSLTSSDNTNLVDKPLQYTVNQEAGDFPGQAILSPASLDLRAMLDCDNAEMQAEISLLKPAYSLHSTFDGPETALVGTASYIQPSFPPREAEPTTDAAHPPSTVLMAEFKSVVLQAMIATGHWHISLESSQLLLDDLASDSRALCCIMCALAAMLKSTSSSNEETLTTAQRADLRHLAIQYYSSALEALVHAVAPGDLPGEKELAAMVLFIFWDMYADGDSRDHRLHLMGAREILLRMEAEEREFQSMAKDERSCMRLTLDFSMHSLDMSSSRWNGSQTMLAPRVYLNLAVLTQAMMSKAMDVTQTKRFQETEARCELLHIQAEIGRLFSMKRTSAQDKTVLMEEIRIALEAWSGVLSLCMSAEPGGQKHQLQLALLEYRATLVYFFQASGGNAVEGQCAAKVASVIIQSLSNDTLAKNPKAWWPAFIAGSMTADEHDRNTVLNVLDLAVQAGYANGHVVRIVLLHVWRGHEKLKQEARTETESKLCWVTTAQQLGLTLLLP